MKLIKLFEEFIAEADNSNFQNGQTYKYQLLDAMGKAVTQKTVTIVPNSYYPLKKREISTSGVIKVELNHGGNLQTDGKLEPPSGIDGLDLQSIEGQPGVFSHPDLGNIYQVRVFPNMNEAVTEQFVAEDAKTDYPAGKYDYHYLDKDFKPIGLPKQNLRVTPGDSAYGVDGLKVVLDKPGSGWNMFHLELSPVAGYKSMTFIRDHPGVFEADFTRIPRSGNLPNPWPEGTTYIRIYKKGEAAGVPNPKIADAPGIADVIDPPASPAAPVNYPGIADVIDPPRF